MKFQEYTALVYADLFRYIGQPTFSLFLKHALLNPSFKYTFLMRTCLFLRSKRVLVPIFVIVRILLRHYRFRYGISIPYTTDIGPGLFISHPGNIVVSNHCRIGKNCNISQGVTIGFNARGKSPGYPSIGDETYIGPGAKLIGGIHIGNNVAVGANCVVLDNIPDHAVVVGIPGKIVSDKGSKGYILNRLDNE